MLPRYLGQYHDNPTYMEELSGTNFSYVRRSEGKHEDSIEVLSLGFIRCNVDGVLS